MIVLLVLFVLLLVLVIGLVGIYNRLVTLRNRFKNAFAQIDVQLKRRHDLIPNLVETVKGYMKHERETLEAVISARNRAVAAQEKAAADPGDPVAMRQLARSEAGLGGVLGRLFALAESYPELKASASMQRLQEELTATENKVAFARQAYNDSVTIYNTAREVFPASIVANGMGFREAALLEIEEESEREAPSVSF